MTKKNINAITHDFRKFQDVKDENDPVIQKYISKAKREFKDDIQKFELWKEYLKRNSTFESICQWFEEARSKYPYPPSLKKCKHNIKSIEDYLVFANNYSELRLATPLIPLKKSLALIQSMRDGNKIIRDILNGTFFVWAVDAGFPKEYETETLMNLFVFGDVYKDPKQITLLRILLVIEIRNKLYACKLRDIIDTIFKHIEKDPFFLGGREASIEQYKHHLKRFLGSDFFLNISLLDPYENKDKTIDAIKNLIDKRRSKPSVIDQQFYEFFKSDQFEWPTKKIRIDELKRYLKAYDLSRKDKSRKEIAKIIHPIYDLSDADESNTALRYVSRDLKKARKIIENVEMGYFPGKYQ